MQSGAQSRAWWAAMALAESTLKNIATGLEMWITDQPEGYPETLQELSPNYLRHIPPAPDPAGWDYRPEGRHYALAVTGAPFGKPGLPRVGPGVALEPADAIPRERLYYGFQLPESLQSAWKDARPAQAQLDFPTLSPFMVSEAVQPPLSRTGNSHWRCGKQDLFFRLSGPPVLGASAADWLLHLKAERFGSGVRSETACAFGELTGWELRESSREDSWKAHRFLLSDGELVWEFSYVGPTAEYDAAVDAAFLQMIETRQPIVTDAYEKPASL
jgi:hypothetical protein